MKKVLLMMIAASMMLVIMPASTYANGLTAGVNETIEDAFSEGNEYAGVTSTLYSILTNTTSTEENDTELVGASEEESETEIDINYVAMDVPVPNHFKSYMDAKWIRVGDQQALKAYYELADNGIWTVDGRYCIAVGSYYCTTIGTKIDLEMENGSIVECILADCKSDRDTDSTHRQNPNGSVVEFVVCTKYLTKKTKQMGDCSYADEQLEGEIKAIRIYTEE